MVLVYLSPVRWASIAQRPHFFVKTALLYGVDEILWIEPTASRLPRISDFRTRLKKIEAKSFDKPSGLNIIDSHFLPVEPFGKVYDIINAKAISSLVNQVKKFTLNKDAVLVAGKPSRVALSVIEKVQFRKTMFDVMDDYAHFSSGVSAKSISINLRKLINKVDECFFSSSNLMKKYGGEAKSCKVVLNACDKDFFEKCKAVAIKPPRDYKVFGYVGSIAQWFDWNEVIKIANDNPHDKIILVGPNHVANVPKLPENIQIKKAISHDKLPHLISSFDYGIIPFKINPLTASVDPVKYYEYLACDLNIISTRFGEMDSRIINGQVADFENYKTFKSKVKSSPPFWDDRFSKIIKELLNEK